MMEDIFRISRDADRARDLLKMARERLGIIKILPRDKPYKIVEEYYEIVKEILTSIMYADGYKTLSHKKLIEYFSETCKPDENHVLLIDNLRKFRNDIVYYGKRISENFLINNEGEIKKVIKYLTKVAEDKLR